MNDDMLAAASRLSDDALDTRLKALVVRDRDTTVEIVALLTERLGRKKHLGEGWGSVYTWCRDELRMSADAAYNRVAAARAVRRFPVVLSHLAAGYLNVTTVKVLRPVLTVKNHVVVLAEAKHRSRKECELIVARLKPKPDVPSTIRPLPTPVVVPPPVVFGRPATIGAATVPPPPVIIPPVVAPVTPERYRFEFTVSKATHDKVCRLKDLLCREVPDGDLALIFDRIVDISLREVEKKKRAATAAPRRPRVAKEGSRHIPAGVSRAVWKRDGERCAFVGTHGRCEETRFLELHHVHPFAHQGPPTVENISVRCRAHNVYESELVFGRYEPSVVRETAEKYAVSGETRAVPGRKAEVIEVSFSDSPRSGAPSFIYYGRAAWPARRNMGPAASWSSVSCRC